MLKMLLQFLGGSVLNGIGDRILRFQELKLQAQGEQARLDLDRQLAFLERAQGVILKKLETDAELNKDKMSHAVYWVMVGAFIFPLAGWWVAVLADTTFGFTWDVANLPNADIRAWAGEMIRFLFFGTSTVALVRALR